mgnify:CR=1 FL=1
MNIHYKVKTEKTFPEALESIKASLSERGFGVLWELNFKEKLQEKGLAFERNFKVLEVCNPKQAKEVLDQNIEAGFFLPCKMVVYEEQDSVVLGMVNPTALIGLLDDADLSTAAANVETTLKAAIDAAR